MDILKIESKIVAWSVSNTRPQDINSSEAPKRPSELSCKIYKVKIKGDDWTICIGLLNNRPYEIFGGLSVYIDLPSKYKIGKIVKIDKKISIYNLIVGENEDELIIKDIANVFKNEINGAFTRILSLALRHGTPVKYIVEQLQKDRFSDLTSFSKVIARVLKTYIKNGTKSNEKICSECNAENSLVYQEGCIICNKCGWSKCG